MKKIMKIIGIVVVLIIALITIAIILNSKRSSAPTEYQNSVNTGGTIETKYMNNGPFEVSSREDKVMQGFEKFLVFYPSEIDTSNKKYPVIVLSNGTGVPLSKYPAVAKHLASWGFIVIGTEENYSWNAFDAEMSIRYLERMNNNKQLGDFVSPFYQKVDLDRVGIVGHSQGGVGVFNAITTTAHKEIFKSAVALSPTNKELAQNLMWDYNAALITIPTLLMSGAGGGDDWVVTDKQLEEIYNDIPSDKVKMRRSNTGHGEMLYAANGYVTAWFMWHLQNDDLAKEAFVGDDVEILSNTMYQDVQVHIGE